MAYVLIVFGVSGDAAEIYDLSADRDQDAILQIAGIDLPYGAELRLGPKVVAKFGSWRAVHDHPEPEALSHLGGLRVASSAQRRAA